MVHSTVGGACGFCVRGLVMGTLWKQCGRWYNFSIFFWLQGFPEELREWSACLITFLFSLNQLGRVLLSTTKSLDGYSRQLRELLQFLKMFGNRKSTHLSVQHNQNMHRSGLMVTNSRSQLCILNRKGTHWRANRSQRIRMRAQVKTSFVPGHLSQEVAFTALGYHLACHQTPGICAPVAARKKPGC